MASTGIIRCIDDLGRVIIPREVRKVMAITEGDPLEITIREDGILLRKYTEPAAAPCYFCKELNRIDDLVEYYGHKICPACIRVMSQKRKSPRKAD